MSETTDVTAIDWSVLDRHDKIAVSFSGGKDSLAVVYMLRDQLDRVVLYHIDTGDLMPETRDVVAHVRGFAPHFVHIQGDVLRSIDQFGLPTDLMPHSAHPIGQMMGEGQPLLSRYDCCWNNLMRPIYDRIRHDGNTLLIRGTKAIDMVRLPMRSGDTDNEIELFYPLQDWSHAQVFAYLAAVDAPFNRLYSHHINAPECARCSAWWSEGKSVYLKRNHPHLWVDYQTRLRVVADAIEAPLAYLRHEMAPPRDAPVPHMLDAASEMLWDEGVRVLQGNRLADTDHAHVDELLLYLNPSRGADIADLGCGFGEVSRLMLVERPDLKFYMVNNNRSQLAHAPRSPRLVPLCGDMHNLPLATSTLDGAMMLYSLCHTDHYQALKEAARITRSDGFLLIYDYERTGGDNAMTETLLSARFYAADDMEALAADAGWTLDAIWDTPGDDTMFRAMFTERDYDAMFRHLRPTIWRFIRQ